MSAFLENLPVNELCDMCFNRFYRLDIHSLMVGIFDPACELLPLVYGCPSTFSLTSPPSQCKHTVYEDNVWMWGGGVELCCRPYSAGGNTLFLTRFRTYKIATTTSNKNDQ